MCVGGKWRELCYSSWGYQEAFVVCRQLGLPATGECVIIYTTCYLMTNMILLFLMQLQLVSFEKYKIQYIIV